jgi:hypothetical protein
MRKGSAIRGDTFIFSRFEILVTFDNVNYRIGENLLP